MDVLRSFFEELLSNLGSFTPKFLGAVFVVAIGYGLARWIAKMAGAGFKKSTLDNKVLEWMGMSDQFQVDQEGKDRVSTWVEQGLFLILFLIALIAGISLVGLETLSAPLQNIVNQVLGYAPNLFAAAMILGIFLLVANVARALVTMVLESWKVTKEMETRMSSTEDGEEKRPKLPETMGNLLFYLVMFIAVAPILDALKIDALSTPLQGMLDKVMTAIPNILIALGVLIVGHWVAKILSNLTTNFLNLVGLEGRLEKLGFGELAKQMKLHQAIGTLVYVLVLVPMLTIALEKLAIDAISIPLQNVLNKILGAIPQVLVAGILVVVGVIVGKWLGDLVAKFLNQVGFDALLPKLGLAGEDSEKTALSKGTGQVVTAVIVLLLATQAFQVMELGVLTNLTTQLIEWLPLLLVGVVIVGLGMYLGGVVERAITNATTDQSCLGRFARYGIITLSVIMALEHVGVSKDIVVNGFTVAIASAGLAAAIAFGLGAKDRAGQMLNSWMDKGKE